MLDKNHDGHIDAAELKAGRADIVTALYGDGLRSHGLYSFGIYGCGHIVAAEVTTRHISYGILVMAYF